MNPFLNESDDFGVSLFLSSKLPFTENRESILHFFEAVQKQNPNLQDFEQSEENEYTLEGDRESGQYQWVSLDPRRLSSGCVNPTDLEQADGLNNRLLEMAPYHLGITNLDTDSLDLVYSFDLMYSGNHQEVVAEVFAEYGPFETVLASPKRRVLHCQPNISFSLDESCRLQCRLSVETCTSAYQVRTKTFSEAPITVNCMVRQYWGRQPHKSFLDSYIAQRTIIDELVSDHVVPHIVQPLAKLIATK